MCNNQQEIIDCIVLQLPRAGENRRHTPELQCCNLHTLEKLQEVQHAQSRQVAQTQPKNGGGKECH